MTSAWTESYKQRVGEEAELEMAASPPVALLLALEGARLVERALQRLNLTAAPAGDCARGLGAFHADTLLNYLRSEVLPSTFY